MPWRSAVKLNAWAPVAVLAAFVSRLWLKSPELTGLPRIAVALLPLLPGLLYARAIWRWARGLDEMQRRIQLEALCFATLAMLFFALAADLLRAAGFVPRLNFGWEGCFAGTFFLWTLGLAIANRRYR